MSVSFINGGFTIKDGKTNDSRHSGGKGHFIASSIHTPYVLDIYGIIL
jgi:hypothetical protein